MQVTEHFDIIVIGAGASGLCAARELTRVKMKILILEARNRIGGRMYTNIPQHFSSPLESGAEFIHGNASYTFQLLKEAHAEYYAIEGNTYQAHDDAIETQDFFDEDWKLVLEKLESLEDDMTFADFLSRNFGENRFELLREKITKFVEGYNAADVTKVSSLALRKEWSEEDDPTQYRIKGGYKKLYDFLLQKIESAGGIVKLNHEVTAIQWSSSYVEVKTSTHSFQSKQCLITVPVSILKSDAIKFEPAIPHIRVAASKIGFGGVIKVTIEFSTIFWETVTPRKFKDLQFLFSDEDVPTWWSQFPDRSPMLTGWIGGPAAEKINQSDDQIFEQALRSLANAMHIEISQVREHLVAWHVDQWTTHTKFSEGAYSYAMIGTAEAVTRLRQPIERTLYFSGEALYSGPHRSTVEAALVSGRDVAQLIVKN